jgi:putative ubiquitin-RnfH superfamily antitoxin RatB of RatAB toxin-antitoxin module
MAEMLNIEVCYAMPKSRNWSASSCRRATLQQALEASGLLEKHPEIDLKKNKFGIFEQAVEARHVLRDK